MNGYFNNKKRNKEMAKMHVLFNFIEIIETHSENELSIFLLSFWKR